VLQITGISHSVLTNSQRILEKLNRAIGAIQGILPVRLEDVLGGVVKNESGYIEGAKAAAFTYFIRNQDDQGNNVEETVTPYLIKPTLLTLSRHLSGKINT